MAKISVRPQRINWVNGMAQGGKISGQNKTKQNKQKTGKQDPFLRTVIVIMEKKKKKMAELKLDEGYSRGRRTNKKYTFQVQVSKKVTKCQTDNSN